jgi:membrane-bound lytic murein transglycosylase D
MNRSWPVHALAAVWLSVFPSVAPCQTTSPAFTAATMGGAEAATVEDRVAAYLPPEPDVPPEMLDLMRRSYQKYLEGSSLIKSGDSEKARAAFNQAVGLLLQSQWELASIESYNRFFQDLIQRIHQDESLYLMPSPEALEAPEEAVVDELEELDLIPITIDPSLQDVVEADLADTKYDIAITLNERVLKALNYWLDRGRQYFISGLMRSGRYRDMIERIFREESIPLDVIYLAQVESLFKTNAFSRAQAKGIWQFGKWTGIRYGLKINSQVDERSDPEKSTRAAARYLNDLYAMFKDWTLVLAAYNCGEARIQKLIEKSGLNDFWELAELRRKLPEETKNHVPLIMASVILGRNPERYGLPTELDEPLEYNSLSISKTLDLRSVAKILKIPLQALKELNPSLRTNYTPSNYPEFELKVPAGTAPEQVEQIASLPAVRIRPPSQSADGYRVKKGDTLQGIARRFRVSVAALQDTNNIDNPRSLRAGSWIRIPSRSSSSKSSAKPASTSKTASAGAKKSTTKPSGDSPGNRSKSAASNSKAGVGKASSGSPKAAPPQIASD